MKFVLISKPDDKPRMTNAELMTNDKWRISERLLRDSFLQQLGAPKFEPKKLPPPTPERREGRLFPPEQS